MKQKRVMEKMNDLRDLLKHEIQDLISAEDQILAALPMMIEKAKNPQLKKSLQEHLRVTETQRRRLDKVQVSLGEGQEQGSEGGLLTRLFRSRHVCKGMQGIIEEGNKVMKEDMHPDVMDAAIIACAQRVEHYEICGYGTARSFAEELNLVEVERQLKQTLDEEYEADRLLTKLAESRINKEADKAESNPGRAKTSGARSSQKVQQEEPEMELVSNKRTTSRTTASGGRSTSAASPRNSSASERTSGSGSRGGSRGSESAARTRTTGADKSSSGRTARNNGSGGRSSSGGRGNTSSRTR